MFTIVSILAILFNSLDASSINNQVSLAVTIYNNQFAIVKDVRSITFDQGRSELYFDDVSSKIQPQTANFKALEQPERIKIIEQNYQANLVNTESILKKYVNKNLEVYAKLGNQSVKYNGTLLGYSQGYILKTQNGIQFFNDIERISFQQLPSGFFNLPTLNWKVFSEKQLTTDCQVAYRTTGFSWKSDYSLILNQDQKKADFTGWVTIDNRSGKRYQNANLKLIAGDVNTVKKILNKGVRSGNRAREMKLGSAPSFSQKSFSDFHMYTLSEAVALNQNSQKQIQFINKVYGISVRRYNLLTVAAGGYDDLDISVGSNLEFQNSRQNNLGIALPKGVVRVFKADQVDGSLQFLGQSSINHTPKGENLTLTVGKAFDVTANKYAKNTVRKEDGSYTSDLNLTISNHKDTQTEIEINFSNGFGDNLKIFWKIKDLESEVISSSLIKIRKVLKAGEKYVLQWSQDYRP